MAWENLDTKQRADFIKASVDNGLSDIDSIRKAYEDSLNKEEDSNSYGEGSVMDTIKKYNPFTVDDVLSLVPFYSTVNSAKNIINSDNPTWQDYADLGVNVGLDALTFVPLVGTGAAMGIRGARAAGSTALRVAARQAAERKLKENVAKTTSKAVSGEISRQSAAKTIKADKKAFQNTVNKLNKDAAEEAIFREMSPTQKGKTLLGREIYYNSWPLGVNKALDAANVEAYGGYLDDVNNKYLYGYGGASGNQGWGRAINRSLNFIASHLPTFNKPTSLTYARRTLKNRQNYTFKEATEAARQIVAKNKELKRALKSEWGKKVLKDVQERMAKDKVKIEKKGDYTIIKKLDPNTAAIEEKKILTKGNKQQRIYKKVRGYDKEKDRYVKKLALDEKIPVETPWGERGVIRPKIKSAVQWVGIPSAVIEGYNNRDVFTNKEDSGTVSYFYENPDATVTDYNELSKEYFKNNY